MTHIIYIGVIIVVGVLCSAVGYLLGKKKKVMLQLEQLRERYDDLRLTVETKIDQLKEKI